jgi:hypothetical protein
MEKPRPDIQSGDIFAVRYDGGYLLREWHDRWLRPIGPADQIVASNALKAHLDDLRRGGDTFVQEESGAYRLVEAD